MFMWLCIWRCACNCPRSRRVGTFSSMSLHDDLFLRAADLFFADAAARGSVRTRSSCLAACLCECQSGARHVWSLPCDSRTGKAPSAGTWCASCPCGVALGGAASIVAAGRVRHKCVPVQLQAPVRYAHASSFTQPFDRRARLRGRRAASRPAELIGPSSYRAAVAVATGLLVTSAAASAS